MTLALQSIESTCKSPRCRTIPWRHQRAAVDFVKRLHTRGKHGAMVCAAMGTGKTAMAIYIAVQHKYRKVLVLCPLRVVQVWKPQFEMHSADRWAVISLDDSVGGVHAKRDEAERRIKLAEARGFPVAVVVNYESAWRSPFAEWALAQDWDMIVADEIHRCKAPGGKASRFLTRLGHSAWYRLGLSGTPMPHSPLDVYAYYRFLDPSIFGWSFHKFRQHYAVMGGYQNHQVVAFRNLDAATDPVIKAILLDFDSPGGEMAGAFDAADTIFAARSAKPLFALANNDAFSAAYLLASGAERLYVSRTSGVGSIGVIVSHLDVSGNDEKMGYKYTIIYAGSHKACRSSRRQAARRCVSP